MTLVFACGDCRMPLDGVANPRPDSMLNCLSCGQAETFNNIRQIVAEYLQENPRDKIGAMLRNISSRSESLDTSHSELRRREHVYRFIVVEKVYLRLPQYAPTVHLIGFRREAHARIRVRWMGRSINFREQGQL
jgi:hypothetical protein